jgi:hypothetical protein
VRGAAEKRGSAYSCTSGFKAWKEGKRTEKTGLCPVWCFPALTTEVQRAEIPNPKSSTWTQQTPHDIGNEDQPKMSKQMAATALR